MKKPSISLKNLCVTTSIIVSILLLAGCNNQTSGENTDSETEDSTEENLTNPFVEQDTTAGVIINEGDFSLVSLAAANTRNDDSSAAIRQMTLTWETASADNTEINYTICEKDSTAIDDCAELGTVTDELTFTVTLDSILEAADSSYFILAEVASDTLSSTEKQIHPGELGAMVGFFKGSNTEAMDDFGRYLALSGNGDVLVSGAQYEDSAAAGINGDQFLDVESVGAYGAAYVFRANGVTWSQTDYIKASNPDLNDYFGHAIAISDDGSVLAIGAYGEDSASQSDQTDNSLSYAGAVYIFNYNGSTWAQTAYIKDSSPEENDQFGYSIALSDDGNRLAVSAPYEASDASSNSVAESGAVIIFDYDSDTQQWNQSAHLEASNYGEKDHFGLEIALSGDGSTLAVGAKQEDSADTGVDGDGSDDDAESSGAVYIFSYESENWSQTAYLKASNAGAGDLFGASVSLNEDGSILAVGATEEDSSAIGINGDKSDNSARGAGAVYLFSLDDSTWSEDFYIKGSNTEGAEGSNIPELAWDPTDDLWGDHFGESVKLNSAGDVLAVATSDEDSQAIGINWDETDDNTGDSGAVYLFKFDEPGSTNWTQTAYIKSPSTHEDDSFGFAIDLSNDGSTLAVGDKDESSGSTGINGSYTKFDGDEDTDENYSGAVYLY